MAWAFKVSIALITKHWRHLNVLNVVAAASVVVVVDARNCRLSGVPKVSCFVEEQGGMQSGTRS